MSDFKTLLFSTEFFQAYADRKLTAADRAAFLKAMEFLDFNEKHPSLRVHQLTGHRAGVWSASASDSLRLLFAREPDGKKRMIGCTKHYDD